MKRLILKIVNGKSAEWQRISLLLLMGFFTGIFLASYDVGVSTLFLDFHKSDEESALAIAFVASGFLGIVSTYLIGFWQKRVKYEGLLIGILATVLIFVAAVAVWLHLSPNDEAVLFCAFVLIAPSNALVILIFWGIFGRIFDFQESKRLAGGIDSGQAIATILAFFSIPFIQDLVSDISDFLFISSLSLCGVFAVAVVIAREITFVKIERKPRIKQGADKQKNLVQRDYIFLMSLFVTCSVLAASFVDFTFLNIASERFVQKDELADYLSFFGGTIIVASFLVQTFLNDFIIEQYGLRTALLILPLLLLFFILVETVAGNYFGFTVAEAGDNFLIFFVVVSLAKLFVAALRDSLESPTVKIFFFPLDLSIRFDTQTKVEGVVSQFAGFLAGLLIIGLSAFKFHNLLMNNYFVLLVIAVWVYATFRIHKSYTQALKNTLSATQSGKSADDDLVVSKLLEEELERTEGTDYEFMMKLSEKMDPFLLERYLLNFAKMASEDKLERTLHKLLELRTYEAVEPLRNYLQSKELDSYSHLPLARTVYQELKKGYEQSSELSLLEEMTDSPDSDLRQEACRLIAQNQTDEAHRLLVLLVRDVNPSVRRQAIISTGKLQLEDLLPTLISYMPKKGFENVAVSAIFNYGKRALPLLETSFYKNGQPKNVQINIVQIYGRIGGERAIQLLLKKIDFPDKRIAKEALIALNYCNWTAEKGMKAIVRSFLDTSIGDALWNKAVLEEVSPHPDNRFLIRAIEEEIAHNEDEMFLLLSILYDKESVRLVRQNLQMGTADSIGYAMELLDVFIEDDLKLKLMPLLDDTPLESKLKKLDSEFPREPMEEFEALKALINRDYNSINVWTKVCAIHSFAKHEKASVSRELTANVFNPHQLIQETATWALAKLDFGAYQKLTDRLEPEEKRRLDQLVYPALETEGNEFLSLAKVVDFYDFPVFSGVSGVDLSDSIGCAEELTLSQGQTFSLCSEMGEAYLFIVKSGSVHLKTDAYEVLSAKQAYEMISPLTEDFGLVKEGVCASEQAELYRFRSERFYEILGDHYELTDRFIHNSYQMLLQKNRVLA